MDVEHPSSLSSQDRRASVSCSSIQATTGGSCRRGSSSRAGTASPSTLRASRPDGKTAQVGVGREEIATRAARSRSPSLPSCTGSATATTPSVAWVKWLEGCPPPGASRRRTARCEQLEPPWAMVAGCPFQGCRRPSRRGQVTYASPRSTCGAATTRCASRSSAGCGRAWTTTRHGLAARRRSPPACASCDRTWSRSRKPSSSTTTTRSWGCSAPATTSPTRRAGRPTGRAPRSPAAGRSATCTRSTCT
jgi:hypothetical protein